MDEEQIKYFVEAALLAAGRPLSVDQLQKLFDDDSMPEKAQIRQAISALLEDYAERGITVKEVASGFRVQVQGDMVQRLQRLWEERPPRYSRALFETLALVAYRQPVTRGEIEEIRGVSVSANIIRSLLEREWIRIVGHRDVPGRPEMFGTTRQFLDYFGLKRLEDLPPLADVSDWESLRVQLNLPAVEEEQGTAEVTELRVGSNAPEAEEADPVDEPNEPSEVVGAGNDPAVWDTDAETEDSVVEEAVNSDPIEDTEGIEAHDELHGTDSDVETEDSVLEAAVDSGPIEDTEGKQAHDESQFTEADTEAAADDVAPDIDFEPIEASQWPDPNAGISRIAAADVNDLREDAEDRDDPETSATGS